jgi:hypothetical protein
VGAFCPPLRPDKRFPAPRPFAICIFQRARRTIRLYKWTTSQRASDRVPAVDRELVIAAQRGDQVAFMDLVRARVDRLFGIARRILVTSTGPRTPCRTRW